MTGVAATGLAACATAQSTAPSAYLPRPLKLCPGGGANLPPADGYLFVLDYEPAALVRGVALARAPVDGCLSSGFGPRSGGMHRGLDLVTGVEASVFAAADGVVAEATERKGYGKTLLIRHRNGVETRYAHLSSFAAGATEGARVHFGQVIGRTGSTGNASAVHLHFEILIDGAAVNPLTVGASGAVS